MALGAPSWRMPGMAMAHTLVVTDVVRDLALDFSEADPAALSESACVLVSGRGCLSNVTVIGPGGLVSPVVVLNGDGARLDHVRAVNGQHSCIRVHESQWTVVTDCDTFDDSPNIGLNYGIVFGNSEGGVISHCRARARRHGVAFGGPAGAHEVTVTDCWIESTDSYAADVHAGCSGIVYRSCWMRGGVDMGGRNNKIIDCDIEPRPNGVAVELLNLENGHHEVRECEIRGRVEWNQGLTGPTPEPGELRILDNVISGEGDLLLLNDYWGGLSADVSRNTFRPQGESPRVVVSGVGDGIQWSHLRMVANQLGGAVRTTPGSRFVTTEIRDNAA